MKLNSKNVYVLLLGATPALVATKSVLGAIALAVSVCVILLLSNVVINLLKKFMTSWVSRLFVVTFFTLAVSMLMNAFLADLYELLGVYLAVVAVTMFAFASNKEAVKVSLKEIVLKTLVDACVFFVVMLATSLVREFLGAGAIFGKTLAFMADFKISQLQSAFGGFLVYGMMIAVLQAIVKNDAVSPEKEYNNMFLDEEAK